MFKGRRPWISQSSILELCVSTSLVVGYVSAFIAPSNINSLLSINSIPSCRHPISCNPTSCNLLFSPQTSFSASRYRTTTLYAKKKPSSGKGKKKKSEQSDDRDDESPVADALLIGGKGKEDESRAGDAADSKELKFQRDRSLDALIIEEPKGQRLDEARTSRPIAKRPLIEIPDEAVVPDPKTRSSENSAVDEDAAFGLSGALFPSLVMSRTCVPEHPAASRNPQNTLRCVTYTRTPCFFPRAIARR